jgi:hypothetical protein
MKKYIIGFAVVLLLAVGWLMWVSDGRKDVSLDTTGQHSRNEESAKAVTRRPTMKEIAEGIARGSTVPIEFWGRILDQNNQPVMGVQVKISISYPDPKIMSTRYHRLEMNSDKKGEFRISGMKGSILGIDELKKDGYVLSGNSEMSYTYYNGVPQYRYHPDPNNPVIFKMWKKQGGERLIKGDGFYYMGQDGRIYTFDLLKKERIKGEGNGDIKISFKRPSGVNDYDKYDWSFEIEGIDGGLAETDDEFLYLAPESGYQKKYEYKQQASASDWKSQLNKSYYVKSRNGQVYACVKVRVYAKYNDTAAIGIEYYANPSGSRNLER